MGRNNVFDFVSGNVEIGNGYGVPGGGAYSGVSRPNIVSSSKHSSHYSYFLCSHNCLLKLDLYYGVFGHVTGQKNVELDGSSEQKHGASELPEYLKQKLRARGILKDGRAKENTAFSDNAR